MTSMLSTPTRAVAAVGTSPTKQVFGVYQGSVVNTNDPLNKGRVQVAVPQVLGTAVSNWAAPLGQSTLVSRVAANQYVYIMFIGGDINQPVYLPQTWTVPVPNPNVIVAGTLVVDGTATLAGTSATTLHTSGLATLAGGATISSGTTISGGATVTGGTALSGGATIDIINGTLSAFKTGNTSSSVTTIVNDPDLQNIPVAANGVYTVELAAFTSGTGNIQYQFSYSTAAPNAGKYMVVQYSVGNIFQSIISGWTAPNTAESGQVVFVKGLFNNTGGTAGTFSFQWGSNTATVSTTVQSASYIKLERRA